MRILGFPLQIRPGFAVFLLLIVVLNGVPLGIWLAGSVAFFTVAHELGHALAARRTGATARISLDFLAGYASFTPVRRLTRRERAGIALAGPLTQILLGVIALLVIGVNPFDSADFASEAHSLAIWWAGPIIGLFNLVPVMPLDGGNVAAELIDLARPGRGRDIMIRLSVPITAGALVGMLIVPDLRPIATFAIILLVIQMQLLAAVTRPDRPETAADMVRLLADAENQAWTTGRPGLLPPGRSLSPWWSASTAISAGDRERARETIMSDLQDESGRPRTWWPPHTATPDLLEPILDVLPRPLPTPTREWPAQSVTTLVWALKRVGRHHEGARFRRRGVPNASVDDARDRRRRVSGRRRPRRCGRSMAHRRRPDRGCRRHERNPSSPGSPKRSGVRTPAGARRHPTSHDAPRRHSADRLIRSRRHVGRKREHDPPPPT